MENFRTEVYAVIRQYEHCSTAADFTFGVHHGLLSFAESLKNIDLSTCPEYFRSLFEKLFDLHFQIAIWSKNMINQDEHTYLIDQLRATWLKIESICEKEHVILTFKPMFLEVE